MKNNQALLEAGYSKFSAPAKLNLFLKIINKRKDGYHNLQSIFQLIDLQDNIFIKKGIQQHNYTDCIIQIIEDLDKNAFIIDDTYLLDYYNKNVNINYYLFVNTI